ncbi:MAG: enoyl-CoA hydratase/isomerase family protein [Chloroflexota bacterium]|nr:enoyl-CoA hydratase/isomerase family protein [Chloroflexota bacterium]
MSEELVLMEKHDIAITISLNRPEKRNAISTEMMAAFSCALDKASADRDVHAVIIRGEGKCFSAGIDIGSLVTQGDMGMNSAEIRRMLGGMQHIFNKIEAIEKPVIVLIHSYCFGLGLELALAGDFRIASDDAIFALQEVELGMIPDVGGTTRLLRTVGLPRAKEIIMMARMIDAHRAYAINLVNEVVPAEELAATAAKWIDDLKGCAPLAVGMAKKVLDRGAHFDKLSLMEFEALAQSSLLQTSDVIEGVMAKMQKRTPNFEGK